MDEDKDEEEEEEEEEEEDGGEEETEQQSASRDHDDDDEEEDDEEEEEEEGEKGGFGDIFNPKEGFPGVGKAIGGKDDDEGLQTKKGKKAKSGGFESMGFSYPVYRGIKMKGYRVPTPIQRKTIPLVLCSQIYIYVYVEVNSVGMYA